MSGDNKVTIGLLAAFVFSLLLYLAYLTASPSPKPGNVVADEETAQMAKQLAMAQPGDLLVMRDGKVLVVAVWRIRGGPQPDRILVKRPEVDYGGQSVLYHISDIAKNVQWVVIQNNDTRYNHWARRFIDQFIDLPATTQPATASVPVN